jgi:hypothetical protein
LSIQLVRDQRENRFMKAVFRISDFKLCCVDTHRNSACSGCGIIPTKRSLATFVKLPIRTKRQRHRREHEPGSQVIENRLKPIHDTVRDVTEFCRILR